MYLDRFSQYHSINGEQVEKGTEQLHFVCHHQRALYTHGLNQTTNFATGRRKGEVCLMSRWTVVFKHTAGWILSLEVYNLLMISDYLNPLWIISQPKHQGSISASFTSLFWFSGLRLSCFGSLSAHSSVSFSAGAHSCFQQKQTTNHTVHYQPSTK